MKILFHAKQLPLLPTLLLKGPSTEILPPRSHILDTLGCCSFSRSGLKTTLRGGALGTSRGSTYLSINKCYPSFKVPYCFLLNSFLLPTWIKKIIISFSLLLPRKMIFLEKSLITSNHFHKLRREVLFNTWTNQYQLWKDFPSLLLPSLFQSLTTSLPF